MSDRSSPLTTPWSLDGANVAFTFDPPRAGAAAAISYAVVRSGTNKVDKLVGTSKNEWFRGLGGDDGLLGGGGHDKLDGGAGNDIVGGGSGNDILIGGSGVDLLDGGTGNDTVSGGSGSDIVHGGKGNDVLTGGKGKDLFWFETALNRKSNVDLITDFYVKDDTVALYSRIFKKAGPSDSILKAAAFRKGAKALDASDRIIYDKATGALYYDPDGTGKAAQVQFAQLKANLALTYKDFAII